MIGVNNLDEVNDILQEWALANPNIGESLDLPEALIQNKDITEVLTSKDIDNFVYVKSQSTGILDPVRNTGVSGNFPILSKDLVAGEYIMPAITAYLWTESDFSGIFSEYNIPTESFTLVADSVNYIGVDYNSGAPAYKLYANQSSFNYSDVVPVCAILYFNSELNVIPFGQASSGLSEKIMINQFYRKEFDIISNFTIKNDNRYVELGALTVNNGVNNIDCPAVDTEAAENDMWLWYKDASNVWQKILANQINNAQYQGVGLQTLPISEFVINYIYRVIDDENLLLFNVLSKNFSSLAEAKEAEMITDLPDALKESAVLVGRMIVERDSSSPVVQKIQKVVWGTV
jgi:hypothetical protein